MSPPWDLLGRPFLLVGVTISSFTFRSVLREIVDGLTVSTFTDFRGRNPYYTSLSSKVCSHSTMLPKPFV